MQWCRKKIASGVGARLNRNLDKPKKEKEKKKIMVMFGVGGGLLSRPSSPPRSDSYATRSVKSPS